MIIRILTTLLVGFYFVLNTASANTSQRPSCTPYESSEQPLERDYKIYTTRKELLEDAKKSYEGTPRLKGRAYWNPSFKKFEIPYSQGSAKLSDKFLKALSEHISKALKNEYVDGVFYPDMGHVHLNLDSATYEKIKKTSKNSLEFMDAILSHDDLTMLYHTAEMFQFKEGDFAKGKFPQESWKLWRYFTRNMLGTMNPEKPLEIIWSGPTAVYNTVRSLPQKVEAVTLYFSSNAGGCFSFQNGEETKYYDITFETIPYQTAPRREPSKVKLPITPH